MSELSETYNLLSDRQEEGVALLDGARIEGFVFPPTNGWITLLPRSEFGQPIPPLIEANTGTLLEYLYDEESGWRFVLFEGSGVVSTYSCSWLDWGNWDDDAIRIDDGTLDIDRVVDVASRGKPVTRDEVERVLHPKIEQRTTPEGATYATFADWDGWDEHPAFTFAELLGLQHYRWMRWGEQTSQLIEANAIHVRPETSSR
jgi:hypothetical protein